MASPDSADWRDQIDAAARDRITNKIFEHLRRLLPAHEQLYGIAARFEERVHSNAVSQHDYLRKISLKVLQLEIRHQQHQPVVVRDPAPAAPTTPPLSPRRYVPCDDDEDEDKDELGCKDIGAGVASIIEHTTIGGF